ncbi:MAG: glycosyltransferase family 2 protein [Planctomycetes bacterium]|nr:glycosyltransferase family 2 protein [Planctomycetota bacterium]
MEHKLISIVVPCYNEEKSLQEFYSQTALLKDKLAGKQLEIIFINDGSKDRTGEILDKLAAADQAVKVIHLARNCGHQRALGAGLDFSSGDIIVTIDADLQDPPELILQLVAEIERGYDIVHAQRRERAGEGWFKLTTARLFYKLMRRLSNNEVLENCGDFRAFNRQVLTTFCNFREPHRFLRGLFSHVGFRQSHILYDRRERYAGKSGYSLLRMIRLAFDGLLSFSATPVRVIMVIAFILWGGSLLYFIKTLYEKFILEITVPGWTSIVILLTFFTGLILVSLGVLGEYIVRIFEQGQDRPLYWVAAVRNLDPEKLPGAIQDNRETELARKVLSLPDNREG